MFYISVKQTVSTLFFCYGVKHNIQTGDHLPPQLVLYDMFLENIYIFLLACFQF